ncbi:RHS repeat-associated core domain-containing protein [Pseudomonas putida]|uniref:RHS repeat-associated core domain-containing protein n=1 Tax=Pseudomonas putida TaxID=303 RepID=UPI00226D7785|nr:RHS repeat-associated core domain-containing protein [Pseudomonas putida]WAB98594.1 RHS repeat-associated core domain-containing protein [Pseudomonas putida]
MLFFYEKGCLAMLMDAAGAERLMRSGRLPLVLGQADCRRLIATDVSSSVLRAITGSTGDHALCYDAYGCDGVPGRAKLSLGFNGELYLPRQTVYALGNGERFYSPRLRRFCSPDKSGPFTSAGINDYAYCRGDPVNFIDPSGRAGIPTLQFLAGREVGRRSLVDFFSRETLAHNGIISYSRAAEVLAPQSMAGLDDGIGINRMVQDTAAYDPKGFAKYMKSYLPMTDKVSATAVRDVINSVERGLDSQHIQISQTLPPSARGAPKINISYTGMTEVHAVRLKAALEPYESRISQPKLPVRNYQPIPVRKSVEVMALWNETNSIRST